MPTRPITPRYLEHALRLLRVGGLAVFDNTLWSGRVLEDNPESADTRAIQALNRALKDDVRVDLSLLPLGDGLDALPQTLSADIIAVGASLLAKWPADSATGC